MIGNKDINDEEISYLNENEWLYNVDELNLCKKLLI